MSTFRDPRNSMNETKKVTIRTNPKRKVYIGTELPYLADGVEFVQWILQHHGINYVDVQQTSTFNINGLNYYEPGFDQATRTIKVGDSLYQPHYLTASGINNAYGELTDMQLQTNTGPK